MKKIIDSIQHPFAPFVLFVLNLVLSMILWNERTMGLCIAVDIVLTVIMVISTLCNLQYYPDSGRTLPLPLSYTIDIPLLIILSGIQQTQPETKSKSSDAPVYNDVNSRC